VARGIGLAKGSKRAIQRNMTEDDVGTFRAQQKKFIYLDTIKKRGVWAFERQYSILKHPKRHRYSDECYFTCALQRQTYFIVERVRKLEKHHQRPNSNLSDDIRFGMYLCILDVNSRALYTSTQAQAVADGLHRPIILLS
jgi:hypothetical protein